MIVKVELFSARRVETVELPTNSTGLALLKAMALAPDAHLVVRGDAPLPLDEPLTDGETLTVLSVVSGGAPRCQTINGPRHLSGPRCPPTNRRC